MKVRFLQSLDLGVTLAVCVGWLVPRLVAECHHHHHHHGECEVGYGEVEDEDEDGLCVDPGLENGGEGGQDDQQIEQGLGNELDDGQSVKTGPHCLPHCAQPQGLARLKTYNVKKTFKFPYLNLQVLYHQTDVEDVSGLVLGVSHLPM